MNYSIPTIIIALVIVSMVVTGTSLFIADVSTSYDDSSLNNMSSISKMTDMQDHVSDIHGTMTNTTPDPSITDYAKGAAGATWASAWLGLSSIGIMEEMVDDSILALPISIDNQTATSSTASGWFRNGLIAIFTIIIIGALWVMVTGRG